MNGKREETQRDTSEHHYVIPVPLHDTWPVPGRRRTRARKRPLSIPQITFAQLKARMTERAQAGQDVSPKSLPNTLSALAQFMRERGYADDQPVGITLRASYYKAVRGHA